MWGPQQRDGDKQRLWCLFHSAQRTALSSHTAVADRRGELLERAALARSVCNIEHSVESRLDYRASMRRTTRAFRCALASTPSNVDADVERRERPRLHRGLASPARSLESPTVRFHRRARVVSRTDLSAVEIVREAEAGAETEGALG
jgi:hypothetical protein